MSDRDWLWSARIALVGAAGLFIALVILGGGLGSGAHDGKLAAAHGVIAYGCGLAAFLAFPGSRRHDLCLGLIVLAALAEAASALALGQIHVLGAAADAAGLLCAYAPAAADEPRRRLRAGPGATPVRHDRRKGAKRGLVSKLVASPAAWLLLAGLAFATLCPIGLRPRLGDPQLERFGAFFITAAAFVAAYPKRPLMVAAGLACAAVGLELGQLLVPGRDAGMIDVVQKTGGAVVGAACAWAVLSVTRSRSAQAEATHQARSAPNLKVSPRS